MPGSPLFRETIDRLVYVFQNLNHNFGESGVAIRLIQIDRVSRSQAL